MNEADPKIKQQVIDRIKAANNILVTVSRNPSVDDLTALIGLSAMLNKMGKRATAIFSGDIPTAINFLDPAKVIKDSADSLRDFIVALDKEKADHLRYKIEGDLVKIFITPYHTAITSDDLIFSQGELNVELVLALGIENKDNLDAILTSQNGIFNKATIVTFCDGIKRSIFGDVHWTDKNASCLSEMVANLSESFKFEKDKTILDKQISTALLTGIIAATERFSNIRTTAKAMTVAAQLIANGANPQLIAAKLRETHEIQDIAAVKVPTKSSEIDIPSELDLPTESTLPPEDASNLVISHSEDKPAQQSAESTLPTESAEAAVEAPQEISTTSDDESFSTLPPDSNYQIAQDASADSGANTETPEEVIESTLPPESDHQMIQDVKASSNESGEIAEELIESTLPPATAAKLPEPTKLKTAQVPKSESPEDLMQKAIESLPTNTPIEPAFGGTLNATAERAAEDSRRELESDRNKQTLTHAYINDDVPESQAAAPINSASIVSPEDKSIDIFNESPNSDHGDELPLPEQKFDSIPTIQPPSPEMMPPLPPTPDFSSMAPPEISHTFAMPTSPALPPYVPPVPSMPSDESQISSDPSQFRIPGQ